MAEQNRLAYELHRQKRKHFSRRAVVLIGIDELWQGDLAEMSRLKRWNRNYKFILTVLDGFSKFGFARPLKTKEGTEVASAFEDIIKKSGRKPTLFQSDQGGEFGNRKFRNVMIKYGIHHYHTYTEKKASLVERWNGTLKTRLYRMFTENNSLNWVDKLQKVVDQYNNSTHRAIGIKPSQVGPKTESLVISKLQKRSVPAPSSKFKTNDIVRISRVKGAFGKGYTENFTEELFRVSKLLRTNPVTYKLEDLAGDQLLGTFYEAELQKTCYFQLRKN